MLRHILSASLSVIGFQVHARPEVHCPDQSRLRIDCRIQDSQERLLFCQIDARLSVIVTSFGVNMVSTVAADRSSTESVYARTDLMQIEIKYPRLPSGSRVSDRPAKVRINGREYRANCLVDKTSQRFGASESTFPLPTRPWL